MAIALEAQIDAMLQDYLPRSILDSLTQMVLGNPQAPVIAVPGDCPNSVLIQLFGR